MLLLIFSLGAPVQPEKLSIDGGSTWCAGDVLTYQYYTAPDVSAISPASGSAQGGTKVTVTGGGFASVGTAVCTFGSLRVGDSVRAGHHGGLAVGDALQGMQHIEDVRLAIGVE